MEAMIRHVSYKGWQNNLELANSEAELILTLDIGPRIISYRLANGPNVLREWEDQIGRSGESDWMIRGGHRLWHGPEDIARTYVPDNSPISYQTLGPSSVRLIQPAEALTGIQKEMDVTLAASGSRVGIVHRLRNTSASTVELAPWALTVLATGGVEIIPLAEKIPHPGSLAPGEKPDLRGFSPNQTLIIWPYADLSDPRFQFSAHYLLVRQDEKVTGPTKIGLAHREGWVGYLREGYLFVKHIPYREGATYADLGCNFETFTNAEMIEIESLGPIERLSPGDAVEHTERWQLFKDVPDDLSEEGLEANIKPRALAAE